VPGNVAVVPPLTALKGVDTLPPTVIPCAWLGICGVLSVVAPALPATLVIDTEPAGVCDAKAVVNATDPPDDAVPETTLSALLSCVVDLVHPVGAAVCTNIMAVPIGNPAAAWNVGNAPAPFDVSI
jgi:hypothetical protein